MNKEIEIYQPKKEIVLPGYISEQNGQFWVAQDVTAEGSPGPYDCLWSFGHGLESARKIVPPQERITQSTEKLIFLGLADTGLKKSLEKNTRLVNEPEANPDDLQLRLAYQQNLAVVYQTIVPKVLELAIGKSVLFSPKRGGELIAQFFKLYGDFPEDRIVDYVLKRIVLNDGSILAGVRNFDFCPSIDSETTIIFGDDCLASYISAYATLSLIKNRACGQPMRLVTGVSTATQRGVKQLEIAAGHFGYSSFRFVGGLPVFGMTNEYYLLRLPDEGFSENTYAVGDMGLWTQALPLKFNPKAPWNVGRN